MVVACRKYYKLHVFVFLLLSIQLFILTPVAFISKFLAVAICILTLFHIKEIKFDFKRWPEIALFAIVNAYLTMSIFGYNLFLDNTMYSRLTKLFVFGFCFIWTSYVFQSFLDVVKSLENIKDRIHSDYNGRYWKKWIILFAVMFVMFLIWQAAFNPIVLSHDSWDYLNGWLNNRYYSFRSPLYSFLISIVATLAPTKAEVLWIALTQNIVFSSLLATILMYLHKRWILFKYIKLVAVVLPLIPSFGLHTIVVWCDLANGMVMLWFTYVLVRLIDEVIIQNTASKKQRLSFYIQLFISMVLSYFIRSNSFLVYVIMAPTLGIFFILIKQWNLLATVIFSIVIVLLIRFHGYSALNVHCYDAQHSDAQQKYFAAVHDIQATYYGGGKLSAQTHALLKKVVKKLDDPEAKAMFVPGEVLYGKYGYDMSELTIGEFIPIYVDSFVRNPFKMIKSMLHRIRAYWVIDPKDDINCVNYTAILDHSTQIHGTEAPQIGVYRHSNFLTRLMNSYIDTMVLNVPATFVWRYGIWTALMLISSMTLILQKRFIWLLAYMPVFVYLVTLILAQGWTDYRYGLPVFFIGLFLPLVLMMNRPANIDMNRAIST